MYNYEEQDITSDEMPGLSVFYSDADGVDLSYLLGLCRGLDILIGAYNFLDLAPKGRDEDAPLPSACIRHSATSRRGREEHRLDWLPSTPVDNLHRRRSENHAVPSGFSRQVATPRAKSIFAKEKEFSPRAIG